MIERDLDAELDELPTRCPDHRTRLVRGYGLMGGGIGTYVTCPRTGCDFFQKVQDKVDDE